MLIWFSFILCLQHANATRTEILCNNCSSTQADWWCRTGDSRLYQAALNSWLPFGLRGCRIADTSNCSTCACSSYVKSYTIGNNNYNGWPRNLNDQGTGCVKSDSSRFCYFNDLEYNLTLVERRFMCKQNSIKNALAQLRHALCNNQCGI